MELSEKPEELVGKLLEGRRLTLGLAESCTGGMIAARITGVPGSSAYFKGCVVSYDNSVKENVLGVSGWELESCGAVSGEVARSMAVGSRRLLDSDISLGVTGIAGPGGGSPEKPVGLVYIALSSSERIITKEMRLKGNRAEVREQVVVSALELLQNYLRDT